MYRSGISGLIHFLTSTTSGTREASGTTITNETVETFNTFAPVHTRLLRTVTEKYVKDKQKRKNGLFLRRLPLWWHDMARRTDGTRVLNFGEFGQVHRMTVDH